MSPIVKFLLMPLAAYIIGATPFGVIIARLKGVDLRKVGSGNIGATNVGRAFGRQWFLLCLALDAAKGFVPVMVAGRLLHSDAANVPPAADQFAWLLVALGAILGHVLTFWLRFKGGKGVATSLGVVLGIYPYFTFAGLAAFALWIGVTLASRYVSLGSVVAAVAFLAFFAAFNWGRDLAGLWPLACFAAAIVILIVIRHRGNIVRLLNGTENKIGSKKQ